MEPPKTTPKPHKYKGGQEGKEKKTYMENIPNAFVNLTNLYVPPLMETLLSFGPKFGLGTGKCEHLEIGHYDEMIDYMVNTGEGEWITEPKALQIQENLNTLIKNIEQSFSTQAKLIRNPPITLEIWNKAANITEKFLSKNPQVYVMNADKGNITVLITEEEYEQKMADFITKGIEKGVFKLNTDNFLVNKLNAKLIRVIKENTHSIRAYETTKREILTLNRPPNNKTTTRKELNTRKTELLKELQKRKEKCSTLKKLIDEKLNKTHLIMPRMYGTIKIHKEDHPIRPIVDTRNTIAGPLAEILAHILSPYKNTDLNIKNTEDLISKLANININGQKNAKKIILGSLDVKDMFTNIPTRATTQYIINKISEDIEKKWTLTPDELYKLLTFATQEVNFFTIEEETFQQVGGLAMGSPLAPIMADLYMDHLFTTCAEEIRENGIIGLYKYVDDILIIGTKEAIEESQRILEKQAQTDQRTHNDTGKVEFTAEYEDEFRSISYLEVILTRSRQNQIITNWYKKDIASDRMLNYLSNHPNNMKKEVCKEYIKKKLLMTSWIFHEWTLQKVYRVLHNNHYPKKAIAKAMEKATMEIISAKRPAPHMTELNEAERKTMILNMSSETKTQQKSYQQAIKNVLSSKPKPRLEQSQERRLIIAILDNATKDPNILKKTEDSNTYDIAKYIKQTMGNLKTPEEKLLKTNLKKQYQYYERIKRKTETKNEENPNPKKAKWTCIPYIQGRDVAIQKTTRTIKEKERKISFYIPDNNRNRFYTCPKDHTEKLQIWNSIAIIKCKECNNIYIMPATGKKPLNKLLKTERNAITIHKNQTGHKLDTKKITTIKIRSGHAANTMASIIANRMRITNPKAKPIIIRKEELDRGIQHATTHKRIDITIQKLHRTIQKQEQYLNS